MSVRCTDTPWWAHDIWDLRADPPRIPPQREHEPSHDRVVKLSAIQPLWLREGVRFWLRTSLTGELLRWSSVAERARDMARHLGPFLAARHITDPLLTEDRAALRLLFTEFSDYLKSPAAAVKPDRPLSPSAVDTTQSQTQVFYAFMVDHAEEAAAATGDARWAQITDTYTRLWGCGVSDPTRQPVPGADLVLHLGTAADAVLRRCTSRRPRHASGHHPPPRCDHLRGRRPRRPPQAARVWLLQALTGRRASEILMLDFDPLSSIPGQERPTDSDDPDAFVAKLRYQQTKVDGVLPTILVEQAVVNVISEQQAWIRRRYPPDLSPKYLFLGLRHQHQGSGPPAPTSPTA